jgi:hypothetical protein
VSRLESHCTLQKSENCILELVMVVVQVQDVKCGKIVSLAYLYGLYKHLKAEIQTR